MEDFMLRWQGNNDIHDNKSERKCTDIKRRNTLYNNILGTNAFHHIVKIH